MPAEVRWSELPPRLKLYLAFFLLIPDSAIAGGAALGIYGVSRLTARGVELIRTWIPLEHGSSDWLISALLLVGDLGALLSFVLMLWRLLRLSIVDPVVFKLEEEDDEVA